MNTFNQILCIDLKERLKNGENILLVDVRQAYEHEERHIPGSILIPLTELEMRIDELDAHKKEEIVVYCKAGIRSQRACQILADHGFTKLANLTDGILAW